MKLLLKIITNPIGIAMNVVHWGFVIFVFYMEGNPFKKETALCFHCEHFLTDWLFRIDVIPLIVIQVIGDIVMLIFGMSDFIEMHLIFLFIFIVIAQWFLVGFLFSLIIDKFKSDKIQTQFN